MKNTREGQEEKVEGTAQKVKQKRTRQEKEREKEVRRQPGGPGH